MTIHNKKMLKRFNLVLEGSTTDSYKKYEHNISKELNRAEVSLQECVEGLSNGSNSMWVSIRDAHKQSKDNKLNNRGHAHQRTYTEVETLFSD